jgi:CheY-like chemotaxis protein
MFAQVERTLDRAQGGLGIGLTLVKRLVELHGGDVSIESEPGHGTLVMVRLPARTDQASSPASDERRTGRGGRRRRVLVVDDNSDAVTSLATLLELEGHDVRTAIDGHEGLRWFESFRPEIVFLDLGMPGLDGLHVARRIRARPNGERTVLVALTGWGQTEDRLRTREAGFDHHLVKPVNPSAVLDLVSTSVAIES